MQYKRVPRIDADISAIGIGCWNFGGDWDDSDDQKSIGIVHAAIDGGINFFDVAPVYGWFHAERVLGKALKNGLRQKVIIASKCGLRWGDDHVTINDLTRENILCEIDASLERLQTDYIDIYQLHWPDPKTPIEETATVLAEIKKAGKIKHIGLSNFSQADVETFMKIVPIDAQQGLYNMLERNADSYHNIPLAYRTEREMIPIVRKYGQAFLPYSPLFQGLLTGRFHDGIPFSTKDIRNENPKFAGDVFPRYHAAALELEKVADDLGKPFVQMSLNWLRMKPEVTSIINGVSSIRQLQSNIDAAQWDIPKDAMAEIERIIAPFEA
ncbi:MAG: aldo/keto reductase [Eubacteriales bacterium]|nr:aldo/keto reductase [Eubacteriales bacterium]